MTYPDFRQGLFSFLDTEKVVEIARLKQWTGSLLKNMVCKLEVRGGRRRRVEQCCLELFVVFLFQLHGERCLIYGSSLINKLINSKKKVYLFLLRIG